MNSISSEAHAIAPTAAPDAAGGRIVPSAAHASNSAPSDEKAPGTLVLKDAPSSANANAMDPPSTSLVTLTKVARLQTYLPTGTWVAFTALQTLAFSLSPGVEPDDGRNCNTSQHIALIVFISISALFSLVQPFIKTFVLDSTGEHIIFPAPSGVEVSDTIHDSVTGATFPYKDRASGRNVWPVAGSDGRWVRQGSYVKVFVFKKRCAIVVRSQTWLAGLRAYFHPMPDPIVLSPREDDDDPQLLNPVPTPSQGTIEGELHPRLPKIVPHWSRVINEPKGMYLDFSLQVWLHALVSLSAFLALALLSSPANQCLYPGMVDWIPVVAQVLTLGAIGVVAAFFVDDRAARPVPVSTISPADSEAASTKDESNDIPPILAPVVADILWVYAKKAKATV